MNNIYTVLQAIDGDISLQELDAAAIRQNDETRDRIKEEGQAQQALIHALTANGGGMDIRNAEKLVFSLMAATRARALSEQTEEAIDTTYSYIQCKTAGVPF